VTAPPFRFCWLQPPADKLYCRNYDMRLIRNEKYVLNVDVVMCDLVETHRHLGCGNVWSSRNTPAFRKNILSSLSLYTELSRLQFILLLKRWRQQVHFFQANTRIFTVTSMRTSKVTESLINYKLGKRSLIPDRSTPTLGPIQLSVFQNVLGILSQER